MLYYNIGKIINEHKTWGNKFIENLAADIRISFPDTKGYSIRNLKYMAKFAAEYPDAEFVQTVSAQIPWSHNCAILDKVKEFSKREWYIRKTCENGWSHSVLIHQIESGLYERQTTVDKISNFESRLAAPQSELAVQTMKDPYVFDFIPFREDMVERDIEEDLYGNIFTQSGDYQEDNHSRTQFGFNRNRGNSTYSREYYGNRYEERKTAPQRTIKEEHFEPLKPQFSPKRAATENFVPDSNVDDVAAGMRIEHDRFGEGTIISVEDSGASKKIVVNFDGSGKKVLLLKFAKIRKI